MTAAAPPDPAPPARIRIGSRRSALARAQAAWVGRALEAAWPGLAADYVTLSTEGDRRLDAALPEIGGKGVFTAELERALREGRVDLAVHSLKDLPVEEPEGLALAAIPEREDPSDVLIVARGEAALDALPAGAGVGTSSPRRASHLRRRRPDLAVVPIRGNVETRLARVEAGEVDAIVLARAGLRRLGAEPPRSTTLELEDWLPAPGQGALAVQAASARPEVVRLAAAIDHPSTRAAVTAERALLSALGAGCHAPVGAWAREREGKLSLRFIVYPPAGDEEPLSGVAEGRVDEPEQLGRALGGLLLEGPGVREWFGDRPQEQAGGGP